MICHGPCRRTELDEWILRTVTDLVCCSIEFYEGILRTVMDLICVVVLSWTRGSCELSWILSVL